MLKALAANKYIFTGWNTKETGSVPSVPCKLQMAKAGSPAGFKYYLLHFSRENIGMIDFLTAVSGSSCRHFRRELPSKFWAAKPIAIRNNFPVVNLGLCVQICVLSNWSLPFPAESEAAGVRKHS